MSNGESASVVVTRNRAIAKGILGGAMGRAASLLAPFVVMPAVLEYLGASLFGTWMTVLSITGMAAFVDFGIGNGLLTKLSRAIGSEDDTRARHYIASAYALLTAVSLSLLAMLVVVLLNISLIFGLTRGDALEVILACVGVFLIGVPVSVIQRVMYASQKVWLSNMWQILGAGLAIAMCLTAVRLELTPWVVIVAYSISPVLVMAIAAFWFFERYPSLKPRLDDVSRPHSKDLVGIGSKFFLLSIITAVSLNIDNAIIAYKLGPDAVTNYAVPAKLASLLGLVMTTIFLPLWPANAEAFARRDYAWVKKTTRKMSLYGGVMVFFSGLFLVLLGDEIIRIWMGKAFEGQLNTLVFLSVFSLFIAVTSPFFMVLNSLGNITSQVKAWSMFLLVSTCAKYVFIEEGSLWIVPAASALSYLVFVTPVIIGKANEITAKLSRP